MLDTANASNVSQECIYGSTEDQVNLYDSIAWALEGLILIILGVFGILANLAAVPILLSRRLANVFNRTLAILAIWDTVYILLDVLESIRQYYKDGYWHNHLFPYLLYPCQNIAMVTSIYLTVIIAMERYLAVSQPVSVFIGDTEGQRWTKVLYFVLPVMIFSIVFNLPTFFEFKSEDHEEWNQDLLNNITNLTEVYKNPKKYKIVISKLSITDLRLNETYVLAYINISRNILTGIFPLVSLAILNYLVYKHLVKRRQSVAQMASQSAAHQMNVENRQAHTLFGVVALFCVGHTLRIILNLHEILSKDHNEGEASDSGCFLKLPFWILVSKSVQRVLINMSASGNLAIYCTANKTFRRVLFRKFIKCQCVTNTPIGANGSVSYIPAILSTQNNGPPSKHRHSSARMAQLNGSMARRGISWPTA